MTERNKTEVRLNANGTLDEVVGHGDFHLEQMSGDCWWMQLGDVHVWLSAKGRRITVRFEDEREVQQGDTSEAKDINRLT